MADNQFFPGYIASHERIYNAFVLGKYSDTVQPKTPEQLIFESSYGVFREALKDDRIFSSLPTVKSCEVVQPREFINKILSVMHIRNRDMQNPFDKYMPYFDIFFSNEKMKVILADCLCQYPSSQLCGSYSDTLSFSYPLLKYCDVNYCDNTGTPLFAYVCKICPNSVSSQYIAKYDFSKMITEKYNIISYLINELKSRQSLSGDIISTLCQILDYIKISKTPEEIQKMFTQYPKDWESLLAPIFSTKYSSAEAVWKVNPNPWFESQSIRGDRRLDVNVLDDALNTRAQIFSTVGPFRASQQINPSFDLRGQPSAICNRTFDTLPGIPECPTGGLVAPVNPDEPNVEKLILKFNELHFQFTNVFSILVSLYESNNLSLFKCVLDNKIANVNDVNTYGYTIFSHIVKKTLDTENIDVGENFLNYLIQYPQIELGVPNILNQTPILMMMKYLLLHRGNSDMKVFIPTNHSEKPEFQLQNDTGSDFAPYPSCFNAFDQSLRTDDHCQHKPSSFSERLIVLIKSILGNQTCNPNIADVNAESPLFTALSYNSLELIESIIKSPAFNINHKYNDGSRPIIKIIKLLNSFDTFNETCEIYFHVLNLLLKNKNVSLTATDLYDTNALMYAARKDDNVVFKKLLECDIPSTDLNTLLTYVTQQHLIVNANLIKIKIASNTSKTPAGKWLFFF